MMLVGPKAGQTIAEFSRQFQYEFVTLLRTRHQTNRVRANAVYNEYIQDKHHVHMNGTRWVTLSGFIMTIGKAGIVKVDEDEKGLWVTWVDSSPKTLAKQASKTFVGSVWYWWTWVQAALQKRDRAEMDGEERERKLLQDQIARAKAAHGEDGDNDAGLQKKEGEKITLNLFDSAKPEDGMKTEPGDGEREGDQAGPSKSAEPEPTKPIMTFGTFSTSTPAVAPNAPSANPLKRPAPVNVFKQAKSAKMENGSDAGTAKKGYISEAERLMREDQSRKMRGPGGYGGFGPKREMGGAAPRRFVLQ